MKNTCTYITILATKIPCKPKMDGNNNIKIVFQWKRKNCVTSLSP